MCNISTWVCIHVLTERKREREREWERGRERETDREIEPWDRTVHFAMKAMVRYGEVVVRSLHAVVSTYHRLHSIPWLVHIFCTNTAMNWSKSLFVRHTCQYFLWTIPLLATQIIKFISCFPQHLQSFLLQPWVAYRNPKRGTTPDGYCPYPTESTEVVLHLWSDNQTWPAGKIWKNPLF